MASKVQIANLALFEVRVDPITSFTDNTKAAKRINLIYDDTVREVIASGEWTSTTFRQTLGQDATAPAWGYSYRYVLPTDPEFLGLLEVNEVAPGDVDYRIENGYLLSNENSMKIKYTGYETDPQKYDEQLKKAIVMALARKLAYSITGKEGLRDRLKADEIEAMDDGQSLNGLNSNSQVTVTNDLLDIR